MNVERDKYTYANGCVRANSTSIDGYLWVWKRGSCSCAQFHNDCDLENRIWRTCGFMNFTKIMRTQMLSFEKAWPWHGTDHTFLKAKKLEFQKTSSPITTLHKSVFGSCQYTEQIKESHRVKTHRTNSNVDMQIYLTVHDTDSSLNLGLKSLMSLCLSWP